MKRAQVRPPKPRQQAQQGGPPAERPKLPADSYGPLDDLVEITRRGYACTACIETKYPPEADLGPVFASLRDLLRLFFTLEAAPGPFDVAKTGKRVGDGILAVYDAIDRVAPAAETPPGMVGFASDLLMAGGRGLPILANFGPGLPDINVPVSDLIPLLEALVLELEEAANVLQGAAAQQARSAVDHIRAFLNNLRSMGPGSKISLASFFKILREVLPRLMELLRTGLTGARFRLALQALLRFIYGLAGLIPEAGGAGAVVAGGGAAGGGAAAGGTAAGGAAGAAGGAAAGGTLYTLMLFLLAFGLGCLIGWLIGNIKIGDKTIHEWLGDCLYWLFWAPSAQCDTAYEIFVRFHSKAKEARDAGDKEGEIAALATAIAAMQQYIALECADDLNVFRRQVARMQARLRELSGP